MCCMTVIRQSVDLAAPRTARTGLERERIWLTLAEAVLLPSSWKATLSSNVGHHGAVAMGAGFRVGRNARCVPARPPGTRARGETMTPGDPTLGRLEESLRPHRRTLSWPYLRQLRLGTCNFAAELWGREQLRTSWMSSGGHQPRGSFGRSGASAAGIAASWGGGTSPGAHAPHQGGWETAHHRREAGVFFATPGNFFSYLPRY